MTDSFMDRAQKGMGAIERLLTRLPLVQEYNDKELRREADHRLRQTLVTELEQEKQRLYDVQKKLLRAGGLAYMDDADGAIQKLQTLIDRIRTASYGYAGLFAAVKIQEEQLDALHRFDVALAERAHEIKATIDRVETASASTEAIGHEGASFEQRRIVTWQAVSDTVTEFQRLFDTRSQALTDAAYLADAPPAPEEWME